MLPDETSTVKRQLDRPLVRRAVEAQRFDVAFDSEFMFVGVEF